MGQSSSTWYTPSRAVKNGSSAVCTEVYLRSLRVPRSGGEEGEGNPCAGIACRFRVQMSSRTDTSSSRDETRRRGDGSVTSRAAQGGLRIGSPDQGDDSLRDAAGMPPDKWIRRLAPCARPPGLRPGGSWTCNVEPSVSTGASPTSLAAPLDEPLAKNRCPERGRPSTDPSRLDTPRFSMTTTRPRRRATRPDVIASPFLRAIPGTLDASHRSWTARERAPAVAPSPTPSRCRRCPATPAEAAGGSL